MNSKRNITFLTAAIVLLLSAGCKKFLDQRPITEVSAEMAFKDVPSAYQSLMAAYSRLSGQEGYGQRVSLYFTVDTDEAQGPTGASDADRRDIARYAATSGNQQLTNPFNQLFQGIEFANICIDNIPKMEMYTNGSEQEKKKLQRMYGEALTLRAQFYFEAIRNWGDLPAHFEPSATLSIKDPFPSKVNRDTLYNRLLADLNEAASLVPWRNELNSIGDPVNERITKGTVKGVRARIALFRGGYSLRTQGPTGVMQRPADYLTYYEIARKETNDIITSGQHGLNQSFKALWKDQVNARVAADPDGELMFQVSSVGNLPQADSRLGFYNGPRLGTLGNSAINPLPTYFYLFDSMDTRRDVTIAAYNINANGTTKTGLRITQLNDGKFRRDWIKNPTPAITSAVQFLGLKWQILRYSDVLLMFSEAENEINGPTAAAYDALNKVRRRAFGKPINAADATVDLAGLSKPDFFRAIVRERSLELGGEGVRKYDLIRWNLLGTALNETKTNLQLMSTRAAMTSVTYMLPHPSYNRSTSLPQFMYFKNNSSAEDATLWANSFYRAAPSTAPANTTRVNWVQAEIATAALVRFATGYTTGKSELFPFTNTVRQANPNLTQNPGYN